MRSEWRSPGPAIDAPDWDERLRCRLAALEDELGVNVDLASPPASDRPVAPLIPSVPSVPGIA